MVAAYLGYLGWLTLVYWPAGHNLEAVTDAEYLEITKADQYDELMAHCHRVMGG